MRMCSCRGPHAGFVHIRCLVKNAEARGEYDDLAFENALMECTQCRQRFTGPVMVALQRAAWLHFVGRAETDTYRQTALGNLGGALTRVNRIDESLVLNREHRGTEDGEFALLTQATMLPVTPEEYSANADLFWSHMSAGANGQRFGVFAAAGERTGRQVGVTWTDDLDALNEANAAMWSNAEVLQRAAQQELTAVSRSISRRIA